MVYYFYIWSRTKADTRVVPSGNFGNLVAGLFAKRMGLPARFIAAVNENDEVPRFLETGKYEPIAPSRKCISNAMNVGNPSNLARLVWLYGGRMNETGKLEKGPDMKNLNEDILSASITDMETREAIKEAYRKGIVLEPHGAVGWAAVQKLSRSRNLGKVVLLETAHPAKFPEELDKLGVRYAIPESLERIDSLKEDYVTISPDLEELKRIISG
jgi:threonine synthase